MAGQPKAPFYLAVFTVVIGLIVFAMFRADIFAPKAKPQGGGDIDPNKLGGKNGKGEAAGTAEAHDEGGVTTVKEYTIVSAQRLPKVLGTANYQPMKDNTVRFALNVWAGWAPIIYANDGFSAGKVWKTADGKEFKVELVLIDDPSKMRDSYSSGGVHIGWATLDMLPLLMEGFVDDSGKPIDSRVMPRIYQQVDWSNGGDGIVVRKAIESVGQLRGKTVVLAQNSPSHYFLLNMLVNAGVQPREVKFKYTPTAFEAAALFNDDKSISAAVSWAPDIYKLSELKENRMLVHTGTANKLIADVWFARADFAHDHPDLIEGIVRGIFDAMVDLKQDDAKQKCAKRMAAGYSLKEADALGMMGDAHSTNWAENYQFFVNQNNPTNFERVWNQAYYLYKQTGVIRAPQVSFDQVMDNSIIRKLGDEEKYRSQKDEHTVQFVPKSTAQIVGAESEILTNTVIIHFFPNSWDLHKTITKQDGDKSIESLYDPKVDLVIEEIGKLAGGFGNARIIIEGHADATNRKNLPDDTVVKELSRNRANAVKEAVIKKFNFDPNKFNVVGMGWDRPADPTDADNHARNRRVEVKIYTAEQQ